LRETFGFMLVVLGGLCIWLVPSGTTEAWWLLQEKPPGHAISDGVITTDV
jgi:hypothetical protein